MSKNEQNSRSVHIFLQVIYITMGICLERFAVGLSENQTWTSSFQKGTAWTIRTWAEWSCARLRVRPRKPSPTASIGATRMRDRSWQAVSMVPLMKGKANLIHYKIYWYILYNINIHCAGLYYWSSF